ncbi:SDR family oxidoreductase [Nocardioides KLBMP 9356]|uniref:SDR family oxidoreductase n=1 Tax=Nocardioides potassii TaxID=2911371 RepID=A0ABS9HD51_9ACTN|nr:SDR family NAD(P)-dependent oxidoreductase [Nocardioides potassii]MCF6378139.1 SDR family oxidoreductase [Nocardioides potassii]
MDATLNDKFNWEGIEKSLASTVTVIAGGARGTGRAAAEQLLEMGARVAVTDIDPTRVETAARELSQHSDRVVTLVGDCTVPAEMAKVAEATVDTFGAVHNVVYSAGAYRAQRPTLDVDSDEWDLILDSNLKGAFVTYQAFLPHIATAGGGALVSISSLAGRTSSPFLGCHYSAAKAGVLGLTRHLAKEFGPQNIRANSICPGGIVGARMNDLLTDLDRQEDLVVLANQTPLGRNVYEQDVVAVILFLLSDLSRFVNGATIDVNGGILTI